MKCFVFAHACSQPASTSHLCRLRDKSPSVRKKAVALLAALLQPAAGLSRPAAAALAGAVLPLAAQLLGVRPDSALHLGEDTVKVGLEFANGSDVNIAAVAAGCIFRSCCACHARHATLRDD